MKKQIIIDISKEGFINIEAVNYSGGECEKATEPFEEVFGVTTEKTYKPEYYEKEKQKNNLFNRS